MEFLDAQAHAKLGLNANNAGGRHFVQIVADEFLDAAHDYPILFTKNADTGSFYAGAIMGLVPGENLLAVDGKLPGYRPADLIREGFFVVNDVIAINRESPVFGAGGESLFDASGAASGALRQVQRAMHMLQAGLPQTDAIIARLVGHRLIEPIDVTLDFDDGSRLRLDGLYSVSLDALHALPDAAALDLFRRGDLQIAYVQSASVRHIRRLAAIRNDRLFAALS